MLRKRGGPFQQVIQQLWDRRKAVGRKAGCWFLGHLNLMVSHQYPRIQSIKVQFTEYKKEEGFILTSQKEDEIMKVQNNSVIINCDGFYLISLKGYFSQEVNISLHYQKDEEPLFQLKKVRSVNSLMVASLTYKDKVYLNVTTDNTSLDDFHVNGGELILIHQNPGEFCVL
ncbi:PREDICTED: tumor necrosis factor ligand superfamily member 4 isoform X2 [Colobus angolensis palliatus]|nr:PREDICTED: tumor necrosis factor ligand superfamily member 4 isoform X2 [Colobus angolensis palliatus]